MAETHNILIVSDLHLGDDLKPGVGFLRHVVKLERELEAFLAHYTATRLGDQPWRLVINGDMVDFLGVCMLPNEEELASGGHTAEESRFGLGSHPLAARAKMLRVLSRHRGVFRALADFIAAGNRLDIVVGNHDAEFHWPIVQQTFRDGVAALAPGVAVADSIRFHPWFYFEENVAWVEHGHQYDGYCSFDYVLQPAGQDGIVMNVASALQRYVTNHARTVEGQETLSFVGYVRWTASLGTSGIAKVAEGFARACAHLLRGWRRFRSPEAAEARQALHRERLRELAARFSLGEETLLAIDALRRAPAGNHLARLLAAVMLDKLMVFATAAVLLLGFALALPWMWALLGVLGTVGAATMTTRRLARGRDPIDAGPAILAATEQLRQRVAARYFVFGHTHDAQAVALPGDRWMLNTGTWVPDGRREGEGFTHVLIRRDDTGPHAALCQWRDGASHQVKAAG